MRPHLRLLTIFLVQLFLFGCASLENNPQEGLIEVEIQQLEKTNSCTGKGVKAYSAFNGTKHFRVNTNKVYVTPGTWHFYYFPNYESGVPPNCEEMEEMILHGEFSVSSELEEGKKYFLKLNKENLAEFTVM
jgi:hypothetical protein